MDEDKEKSLISRPGSELTVSKSKANQIGSRMARDVLARTQSRQISQARFPLGDYEFREPDYRQILRWAEALEMAPEAVLGELAKSRVMNFQNFDFEFPEEWEQEWIRFAVEDGAIVSLAWDLTQLPPIPEDWERGLRIHTLALEGAHYPDRESGHAQSTLRPNLPELKSLFSDDAALESLDLSLVPRLNTLSFRCHRLKGLDLSPVTGLKWLQCAGTYDRLKQLDLSPVLGLTFLDCSRNGLTELDLSPVQGLRELACCSNGLTELDLSPVQGLQELACSHNQLTELDLSEVPWLGRLYCSSNQLTELDLSEVPWLAILECDSNQLTELDLFPVPNLSKLRCDGGVRIKNAPRGLELFGGTIVSYTDEGPDEVSNSPDVISF